MTEWRVAIPSWNRPDALAAKTLAYLGATDLDPERIDVHVRGEAQAQLYRSTLNPDTYGRLVVYEAPPGVRGARNHVARHYPEGFGLVSMDDDVEGVYERLSETELVKLTRLTSFIDLAFAETARTGYGLWGVYPIANPYFMKDRVRTSLCPIVGPFFGHVVTGHECELATIDDKDDYQRTIEFYKRDGGVVRMERYAVDTKYYTGQGGLQDYRTEASVEAVARHLADTYPEFCTYFTSKSRGAPEVRLKDKRVTKTTTL